jgi:hypothetical protein
MSGASTRKKLLSRYNKTQYRSFTLNNEEMLCLPVLSSVPGIITSKRKDIYKKFISHPNSKQHVKFITKNDEAHSFLWQTTPQHIVNAVRWGIIRTHSITSKVISTLGTYRIVAHKRVAKGMISNSQTIKLKLIDLFQVRFEALQSLESLVNKPTTFDDYESVFASYVQKLTNIKTELNAYFNQIEDRSGLDRETLDQIESDLQEDISRAESFHTTLNYQQSLSPYNRARGEHSILEFVKEQMIHGLYELQGINQDLTYSSQRQFALTRGELNDFIEDARKEIDNHQADLRNAVTEKHHGLFSKDSNALISYDFSEDGLNPDRQRDVLLAISFIEGWDKVDAQTLTVQNESGSEQLDLYAATKWQTHRNFTSFFKSIGHFLFNMVKSLFFKTTPWDEETWENRNFHLVASELHKHVTPLVPFWQKVANFFDKIKDAISDLFHGYYDLKSQIAFQWPVELLNDWNSCKKPPSLAHLFNQVNQNLTEIATEEKKRLNEILNFSGLDQLNPYNTTTVSKLASVEYALSGGEQNDVLTVIARSLKDFTSELNHSTYGKDPIGGLLYTAGFALGAGAVLMPSTMASIVGPTYVQWLSDIAYSVSSSKWVAAVSGASTQAQFHGTGWDFILHGPRSGAFTALHKMGEDPLAEGVSFISALGIGYVLANGIGGRSIPYLDDFIKEHIGTSPATGYSVLGGPIAEAVLGPLKAQNQKQKYTYKAEPFEELVKPKLVSLEPAQKLALKRFELASWLSLNSAFIPKLKPQLLFELSRHIEVLFNKEQSDSLKKILFPEKERSAIVQFFFIPLTYIPAVLRLIAAPIISIVALISKKSHPFEPIKRSFMDLVEQCKKDLSRLLVFGSHMISALYLGLTAPLKACVYVATMLVGRIASLFGTKTAHAIHKVFASIHAFMNNLGELFFPARAIKSVTTADPIHTLNEINGSYINVLKQIGNEKQTELEEPKSVEPNSVSFSFKTDKPRIKEDQQGCLYKLK